MKKRKDKKYIRKYMNNINHCLTNNYRKVHGKPKLKKGKLKSLVYFVAFIQGYNWIKKEAGWK